MMRCTSRWIGLLLQGWQPRVLARLVVVLLPFCVWLLPVPAALASDGASLFEAHCAGCHVNGGNIIRRGKTLRLAALERQDLASQEAIARIAAAGIGQMGGYQAVLGDAGVDAVAAWVWQQAQAGWPKP
jgi:cytochrome c6